MKWHIDPHAPTPTEVVDDEHLYVCSTAQYGKLTDRQKEHARIIAQLPRMTRLLYKVFRNNNHIDEINSLFNDIGGFEYLAKKGFI